MCVQIHIVGPNPVMIPLEFSHEIHLRIFEQCI